MSRTSQQILGSQRFSMVVSGSPSRTENFRLGASLYRPQVTGVATTRGFQEGATAVSRVTGVFQVSQSVMPVELCHTRGMMLMYGTGVCLEFHYIVKFRQDSCLECNGMITINVSELIPHLGTKLRETSLNSGVRNGMSCSCLFYDLMWSYCNLTTREVLGKV